ncbi:hypothetical protein F0U61_41090 [Archangium violaceum]|uniref:hypothetical protein n=1 Tax=Archangium violaceum TaxID=83451 RepID=UPI002B27F7C0|nr:hypothetical protein F0U61_41090 [Archangium violaceum]
MGLLNPSFEEEGPLPGEARHWTLTAVTSREVLAGFGPAPEEAWEDFERWHSLRASLDDVPLSRAFFDSSSEGHEDFDEGWANAVFLTELPPAQVLPFPFNGGTTEDCESGWANVPYARSWGEVASSAGLFDGEPHEDFEEQWRSNQAFAWSWSAVPASAALFDAGVQPVEDFENTWTVASTL